MVNTIIVNFETFLIAVTHKKDINGKIVLIFLYINTAALLSANSKGDSH